ncbi:MAG: hypothetical protein H6625_08440 [Bdellovibrionaceae bacterium]|nr:hypothetical protein [Pseudobdellovibrionaceae bacterium]
MGQEIADSSFSLESEAEFLRRLREETKILMSLVENREFEYEATPTLGLEIEAWLIDKSGFPNPINDAFLKNTKNDNIVHELSQFNFELNLEPLKVGKHCFTQFENEILSLWKLCQKTAEDLDARTLLIGTLPMIREQMLQLNYISNSQRYRSLNQRLFEFRKGLPLKIDIKGEEHFQLVQDHLMLEAAATSIQVHFQVNQDNFKRVMNASNILSAPLIATAANAPFLYGYNLWSDTRIAIFEQAVNCPSFRDKKGDFIGRVGFGTGYIKHSVLEPFLENLDGFHTLLPYLSDPYDPQKLDHLRLQNGTVWRWNRPIIGFNGKKKPHLRIEQRVMSSGPTPRDIVANMAFYCGLVYELANLEKPMEESFTFTDCRQNFYQCAQKGLSAHIQWLGKRVGVQDLLLHQLIPKAKLGLKKLNVSEEDIQLYINETIYPRVLKGQNGTRWQRSYVDCHGRDFQGLTQRYWELQNENLPVHSWEI